MHFQPPKGYTVNKCTDLVEHTFVGDGKVGASFASDVDNYMGYHQVPTLARAHSFYYCFLFF
jgi:hypothetical protein